jgi:phosphoserine phosphatase
MGIDFVVAGRYAVSGARYTGRMEGLDCRGAEKVRRLQQLVDLEHYDWAGSRAWSDSTADRPLLGLAGKAWYVNRKRWELQSAVDTEHA